MFEIIAIIAVKAVVPSPRQHPHNIVTAPCGDRSGDAVFDDN